MNAHASDETLLPLRRLVERAVRPVVADDRRKMRMREEMLAHLLAVFAEQRAAAADDAEALDRTRERFGPPEDLTPQLQATVPRIQRLHAQWLGYRWNQDESFGRFAVRHLLVVAVQAALFPVLLIWLHPGIALPALGVAAFLSWWYLCVLGVCGAGYGVLGLRRSRGLAAAFAAGLLAAGLALTGTTFVAAELPGSLRIWSWVVLGPCVLALVSVAGAAVVGRPIHQAQPWQQLELE